MTMDVVDLREFYNSSLGQLVRLLLRTRLARFWPDVKDETIAALGYATPLLRPWLGKTKTMIALMPDTLGVAYWPREGQNIAGLVSMEQLPLPDESVSRVILMHALETVADPAAVLQEVWRILKPNGQVMVIVPNRRGLWAHSDHTPFGTGQPYSSSQLRTLLREQGFCIEKLGHALFMPPWDVRLSMVAAPWIEKIISVLMLGCGGVLMMQAGKQVFSPAMVKNRSMGRRLVLPMPFPSSPLPTGRKSMQ
ncbi:MAG TPA: methyltransferase type 11 [Rhodospirillaceae bacterium]|nr:methyltransferase type 11 [Rhodospirillaceae bacterium]